ncbi:hypothetical protein ACP4OV_018131 [Aristida adscensionis]
MEAHLSRGAVAAISEGRLAAAAGVRLVLQVSAVNRMVGPPLERYGLGLSDGAHLIIGVLPRSASHLARDGRIRGGTVVRLLEFAVRAVYFYRVIEVKQLEVLQADCVMIGHPKKYQSVHLGDKHEESDAESATKFTQLNTGAYSAGQGLKEYLTSGVVAVLQQPVVQDATLASHLNHLIKNSHLCEGTIVRLLEFMCDSTQSPILLLLPIAHVKRTPTDRQVDLFSTIMGGWVIFCGHLIRVQPMNMIIVTQLEVLQKESELIGSPKAYKLHCTEEPSKFGKTYSTSVADYGNPYSRPYSCGQGLRWHLTQGTVAAILDGEMSVVQRPVMQVVDFLERRHNRTSCYRMLLSDGVHQVFAELFPHLSHLVKDNCLRKGAIVRVLKFMCDRFIFDILNHDQSCRFTIAVELEVLERECKLIGSPTFYRPGNKSKELNTGPADYILLDDLLPSTGESHPTYKAAPG